MTKRHEFGKRRMLAASFFVPLLLLVSACSEESKNNKRSLEEDFTPRIEDGRAIISEERALRIASAEIFKGGSLLSPDHEAQVWLSAVVEKLVVEGKNLGMVPEGVPYPVVRFIEDNQVPTAYTVSVPVCHDQNVRIQNGIEGHNDQLVLTISQGAVWARQRNACIDGLAESEFIEKTRDEMWERSGCSISEETDRWLVSDGCPRPIGLPTDFTKLAVTVDGTHVLISTEMVKHLSEGMLIATVAHELGHYYLGIGSATPFSFSFFDAVTRQTREVPPSDPGLAELALEMARVWVDDPSAPEEVITLLSDAHEARVSTLSGEDLANEFAIDLLYSAGYDPRDMINTMLVVQKSAETALSNIVGGYTGDGCRALAASAFRDPEGNPVVPAMHWVLFHHQPCHEAFTTHRQLENRGWYPVPLEIEYPEEIAATESEEFKTVRARLGISAPPRFDLLQVPIAMQW